MPVFPFHKSYILKEILFITLFFFCNSTLTAQHNIRNYKAYFAIGNLNNNELIIIRSYENSGKQFYLCVDPDNLETLIIPSDQLSATPLSWQQILNKYKTTAYVKALLAAKAHSVSLQNSGITHGYPKEKGVTLTIDLCPSHKPLDRIIFTSLLNEFKKTETPVPIALSISGKFMLTHTEDLKWLKKLIDSNEIYVTWINHTFNHKYNPKKPLKNNFLLEPGTDLNFEITGTEIALLEHGFIPSTFIRFPGLISNHDIVDSVTNYGLIPIGSDAWLAKGQQIHVGSIVLIHGNGNEPLGIKDFIKLLQMEKLSVIKKEWLLYDLRESIENEFQE